MFSFLRARRWRSAGGQPALLIWMRIGMWSLVRAHSLIIPQKLTFLYKFGDINMKSIIFSCCPFFYIGFSFGIASTKPLVLVLASKRSACFSLAMCFPPYIRWWALKLFKSMISPLAFLIVVLILGYVLI